MARQYARTDQAASATLPGFRLGHFQFEHLFVGQQTLAQLVVGHLLHVQLAVDGQAGGGDGRLREGLNSGPGGNPFNELECGKFKPGR